MSNFDVCYGKYLSEFEAYTKQYVDKLQTYPEVLGQSMQYSLLNGGKRIRPVLMLACAEVLGVDKKEVLPYALALEMIHAYSLIHDDLPCVDNDDYRRGQPSNHKKFGEANALFAGDGLLNEAYSLCFEQCLKGDRYVIASQFLNDCAGIRGMLAGQAADLYFSQQDVEISEKDLNYIYNNKTGKLLLAPVVIPGIIAANKYSMELESFGKEFGVLFQITDDILDVTGDFEDLGKTIGKDEQENKLTCIRLYGLEGAKLRAEESARKCLTILEGLGDDTEFLQDLIMYVLNRKK